MKVTLIVIVSQRDSLKIDIFVFVPNPDLPRLFSLKVVQDGVFNANTGALSLTMIYLGFFGGKMELKRTFGENLESISFAQKGHLYRPHYSGIFIRKYQ